MRRASLLALGCLLLAGCATGGGRRPSAAAQADALTPSPFAVVGHIIAVDGPAHTVIIDVAPFAALPPGLAGRILLARTEDLRPTARLQASPYLRGRTLGALLLAGRPNVGDEVVIPPPSR